MGIITVNGAAPALEKLQQELTASGAAGKTAADAFQPTVKGLIDIYGAATKAGIKGLGNDFYEWGLKMGVVNNSLNDASGRFLGLDNMFAKLHESIKNLPQDQANRLIADAFNKTAQKAVQDMLNDYQKASLQVKNLEDRFNGQGQAQKDADLIMGTYSARLQQLQTTLHDVAALIGGPIMQVLSDFYAKLSLLAGGLTQMNPHVYQMAAQFLVIGAIVSGVVFIISTLIFVFGALGTTSLIVGGVVGVLLLFSAAITLVINNFNTLKPILQAVAAIALGMVSAFLLYQGAIGIVSIVTFAQLIPAMVASAAGMLLSAIRSTIVSVALMGALTPALIANAAAWVLANIPMLLTIGAVILLIAILAGLVAGIVYLMVQTGAMNVVLGILHKAWTAIVSAFQSAVGSVLPMLQSAFLQLIPAWNQIVMAFNEAKPVLTFFGIVMGVILVAALGVLIGVITGVVRALVGFLVWGRAGSRRRYSSIRWTCYLLPGILVLTPRYLYW